MKASLQDFITKIFATLKNNLKTVAFTGNYYDLNNRPTIPNVGNGTITITQNGTTKGTFTTNQNGNTTVELTDNNTTYSNFVKSGSGAKSGLVPAPSTTAGTTKYLREDGTWTVPPDTNTDTKVTAVGNHYTPSGGTTTSASGGTLTDITNSSSGVQVVTGVTKDAAGHVTGVTSVALKSTNTNTTYGNMKGATSSAAGSAGLVPAPAAGKQNSFLRGDGTWYTTVTIPSDGKYIGTYENPIFIDGSTSSFKSCSYALRMMSGASSSADGKYGLVPAPTAGKQASFLRGDGTWAVPSGFLPLTGGTMTGNIAYKGSKATYTAIKFIDNTTDAYGNGISIGSGGLTIIGGGESADVIAAQHTSGGDESMIIANDGTIDFYSNCQNGFSSAAHSWIDTSGRFNGNVVGNASSASKLTNTSAIGSSTQPVYFSASGVPTPTTYTLGTSVPANTKHMVYYEVDLSRYSNTLFYPLIWAPNDEYLDVSIQSPNLGGNAAYNQNDLHAIIRTQGWSDTPISYQILELNRYSDSEQTIMSLVRGLQTGTVGFYLRGGMKYRVIANRGYQKLCTSDYTYGSETWKAGISSVTGTIGSNIVTWRTLYDIQNGSQTNNTLFSGVVISPRFIATTINVSGVFSQNRTSGSTVGENSFVGNNDNTASGISSTAFGGKAKATSGWSFAEGWNTTSSGTASHAEGWDSVATNDCAHAEGKSNTASGFAAHAEGEVSVASGTYSHAEGHFSTASGESSHSEGNNCTAKGIYSHAGGNGATGGGYASLSQGWCTSTSSDTTIALGRHNKNTSGNLLELGYGSDSVKKNVFSITSSGYVKATGTYTASTTADYAEYFEWLDGNPNGEDRVGYFVTLEGNKIRLATKDDAYILGIVSGEPFVLGNGDCDIWNGIYLRDEFRRKVMEDAPKLEVYTVIDEETGEELTDIRESETEFEGYRPKLNPEYDSTKEYIPRSERPEWAPVGMLGVLAVRHDGTAKVNSYVTVNKDGIATACYSTVKNSYRVIKENSETVVEIIFR